MMPDFLSINKLVDFARLLRAAGIKCSISEVIDAANAVRAFGPGTDVETIRYALKCTLLKDIQNEKLFDQLFDWFWLGGEKPVILSPYKTMVRIKLEEGASINSFARLGMYSPLDLERKKRLKSVIDKKSVETTRRIVKAVASKLRLVEGRRRRSSDRGEFDFNNTLRRALSTMGEILEIKARVRKRDKARLVLLLDVSGSMEDYWSDMINLIASFKRRPSGSYEIFIFSSRVERITELVNTYNLALLLKIFSEHNSPWGSGTRIGESLHLVLKEYSWVFDRRKTVAFIVSDGWDLGDLSLLESSLAEIKSRCYRLFWLTPYESHVRDPSIACLKIASRYVDGLLPLHFLKEMQAYKELSRELSLV